MAAKKKRILVSIGTRPEAIKMAPLIKRLEVHSSFEVTVCVTGQHRAMLDQVLDLFEIKPQYDLNLMKPHQSLTEVTTAALSGMTEVIQAASPNLILVHGDTTTTMASSLAAFYQKVPLGHVEAGLRTGDLFAPWPEEANRKIAGTLAQLHFAPTESARMNLLKEQISPSNIHVTGNTVIDALCDVTNRIAIDRNLESVLLAEMPFLNTDKKIIMVTAHRRENFGKPIESIFKALRGLADRQDCLVAYPVHLNPHVSEPAKRILGDHPNVKLLPPLDYLPFVFLLSRAYFVVTDSGGVQEEAPSLGKPVLVLRSVTERPEAVLAGTVKLVGYDADKILAESNLLFDSKDEYLKMSHAHNPYGDGKACERIIEVLEKW